MTTSPLTPGGRIGIVGGGQLGRMLAQAASALGFCVHIFSPDEHPPAADVATHHVRADYSDQNALRDFARNLDRITYEFENIPVETVRFLETLKPVAPSAAALEVAQDRLIEKTFIKNLGIAVAPFIQVDTRADLEAGLKTLGGIGILKTRRFGYDGKGQWRINSDDNFDAVLTALNGQAAILEGLIDFSAEVSVIIARAEDGTTLCYDVAENTHENHILRLSRVPANLSDDMRATAAQIAHKIATALDYVGILAIELFVTQQGLLVNEIAPRVHNSGHWTMDACVTSQFTQHMRALAGWPLGSVERHSDVAMTNILGEEINDWRSFASDPACCLHLYGKAEARAGRKMGHVNRLMPRSDG